MIIHDAGPLSHGSMPRDVASPISPSLLVTAAAPDYYLLLCYCSACPHEVAAQQSHGEECPDASTDGHTGQTCWQPGQHWMPLSELCGLGVRR